MDFLPLIKAFEICILMTKNAATRNIFARRGILFK